ncbi:MAG: GspE/PulE family protein [bacterium]|nr:GspE/PulE family protein [bacterium]
MSLLEVLVKNGAVTKKDAPALESEAKSREDDIESVLLDHGISQEDIFAAKAELAGIPFLSMEGRDVAFEVLQFVPEESAVHYRFVPLEVKDGALEVGIVDPENMEARDALAFISSKLGMPYKLFLISQSDFEKVVQSYKGLSGEVTKALSELETELSGGFDEGVMKSVETVDAEGAKEETKIIEDAPVTKIVATILHYAASGTASDIHIEHMGSEVRVRFRVDGILNTSLILPVKIHAALVARIKILSNMRLDEKRKPQDGRFSARIEGRRIDFRVSSFPAYYGEKMVMRILDTERGVKTLETMGLSERNVALIKDALERPYGMVLLSGPTGSGKSTTLYAMLNQIDREKYNVLSLEDPVEYNIPGMSQSQVRPEIGYTFATGLRHALRQDPDVIMVGEIRDKETAQLAVQAALTGHLVFSTIHTNNAAGVIPRLLDMGVDPFLIAPTLILAIAQRLVPLICEGTGKSVPLEGSIKALIDREFADLAPEFRKDIPSATEVLAAEPSSTCPKGTRGRVAVFEVLQMDKGLEDVVLKHASEAEVMKVARSQGMLTMKEDAILKALRHEIPWEEVNKL